MRGKFEHIATRCVPRFLTGCEFLYMGKRFYVQSVRIPRNGYGHAQPCFRPFLYCVLGFILFQNLIGNKF